jgi:hypothetical protein
MAEPHHTRRAIFSDQTNLGASECDDLVLNVVEQHPVADVQQSWAHEAAADASDIESRRTSRSARKIPDHSRWNATGRTAIGSPAWATPSISGRAALKALSSGPTTFSRCERLGVARPHAPGWATVEHDPGAVGGASEEVRCVRSNAVRVHPEHPERLRSKGNNGGVEVELHYSVALEPGLEHNVASMVAE